jgi:hypothetical protein
MAGNTESDQKERRREQRRKARIEKATRDLYHALKAVSRFNSVVVHDVVSDKDRAQIRRRLQKHGVDVELVRRRLIEEVELLRLADARTFDALDKMLGDN